MAAPAIGLPIGRIGAPEAKQDVLRRREIKLGAKDLDDRNHDVQIEEEVQVHMRDAQLDRRAVAVEL